MEQRQSWDRAHLHNRRRTKYEMKSCIMFNGQALSMEKKKNEQVWLITKSWNVDCSSPEGINKTSWLIELNLSHIYYLPDG